MANRTANNLGTTGPPTAGSRAIDTLFDILQFEIAEAYFEQAKALDLRKLELMIELRMAIEGGPSGPRPGRGRETPSDNRGRKKELKIEVEGATPSSGSGLWPGPDIGVPAPHIDVPFSSAFGPVW